MAQPGHLQAFNRWATITLSDTVNFDGSTYSATATVPPVPCDAMWVSVAGSVNAVMANGRAVQVVVASAGVLRIRAIRVNTGGTATGLLALYQV